MSKKLIFTFVILLVSISGLVYVKFFFVTAEKKQLKQPIENAKPKNELSKIATLSLLPNPVIATSSAASFIDVTIQTESEPTLIQLEIRYDPSAFYSINIIPGDYFKNPSVPLEKIDYKNGRISYALSSDEINKNSNLVAKINFVPIAYGVQKTTTFEFLAKTSLKENSKILDAQYATGSAVVIQPSFFRPIASPSASIPIQQL